jgi:hypothetical protein
MRLIERDQDWFKELLFPILEDRIVSSADGYWLSALSGVLVSGKILVPAKCSIYIYWFPLRQGRDNRQTPKIKLLAPQLPT